MISDTPPKPLELSTEKRELLRKLKRRGGLTPSAAVPLLQPVNRQAGEPLPLSFAQQRLWLLDQLENSTSIYNIPLALRLLGNVHVPALMQAIEEIVRRHEALRTAFIAVDGVPYQNILPAGSLPIPLIDLRHLPLNERRKKALAMVADEGKQPFDLTCGPLLRAQVLQLDADEYILNLCMHHITSDAWSVEVFFKELFLSYKAFVKNKPSPLPNLPVQYADYAVWQRQWLQGEELERQISYWREKLNGLPALLPLPTDHPRPAIQTFRGATTTFHLSPDLTQALKALSQREGVTLFMMLLSAFKVWLYQHTRQRDIAVGTPMANRQHAGLEHLIGFFINTLVLRSKLSGESSFRALLQQVRQHTLEAFAHREVPFEMVVDVLQMERNLSYTPLFQVLFTLQTKVRGNAQPADFLIKPLDEANTVAKFDLLLAMTEESKNGQTVLTGNFEYNCDLFDATTIDRFVERFLTLLEAIVARPEQSLDALPWFSAAERELVLQTWNATGQVQSDPLCLHQGIEEQVLRTPHQLALVTANSKLTYSQLDQQANQFAHALRKRGVQPGAIVGLCLPRTADLLVALLAILKCGGAYLPLDPSYPPERLHFQIQDAQARLLLTNTSLETLWEGVNVPRFLLDKERVTIVQEARTSLTEVRHHPEQLAYIIYTSGSTGRPKGVCITQRNARVLVTWGKRHFSSQDLSGVLASTSICFDLSIFEIFVPLSVGGTVYLVENGLQLPAEPERECLTLINTVPAVIRELVRNKNLPTAVRVVNLAGEPLSRSLVQELYQIPTIQRVYNLYGPTEDTTYSTWELTDPDRSDEPSIGRSLDQRQVYVLNEQGDPLPIGITGEVYLGGAGLTRGYLGQPALTAERFVPDPFGSQPGGRLYRTGDLARWLPAGRLAYLGRNDYQVKIRGFRIEPGEIEQRLALFPLIKECAVQVQHDPSLQNPYLTAYAVPTDGATLSARELRTHLQHYLPAYMLPAFFVFLETLPRTENGKINRKALLVSSSQFEQAAREEMLLPRDLLEEAVTEVWRQLLGREVIGLRENFFELGGHSLLGTQVISRLRATLGVDLPLRRLFETPTIEGLAEAVRIAQRQERKMLAPVITPVPRAETTETVFPLSFAQQRLWLLDRLAPGRTTYTMPFAWQICGVLDQTALECTLLELVTRHAGLRTTFPLRQDMPVQQIAPAPASLSLSVWDLRELPAEERLSHAHGLLQEEIHQPFQLDNGPLWRARLIRIDDQTHIFFFCMHHIISDGWSLSILRRELAALYRAHAAHRPSPLAPLALQYADYALWQRDWLQGEVLQEQLSYWRSQLADAPDQLLLPTDRPRGAIQSFRGASHSFTLSADIIKGLHTLGQQAGATLFMTLCAAFQALLHRYSNQDDIVIGTPMANRNHAEIEGIIGCFVNTLALRTCFSGNPSFLDILRQVRQTVLDAFTYQDLPFEQVVEAVQPERDLARSPLIQVMFTLQTDPHLTQDTEPIDPAPLHISAYPFEQATAKFDLTLTVNRHSQGCLAEFEYNTDLFDAATIARMSEHFTVLLRSIVQNSTAAIERLPLLPAAEHHQIMNEWNATDREYSTDRLAFELVEEQARLRPQACAVREGDLVLTYGELDQRANQLARVLVRQGVKPGTFVGIYTKRSREMIIGLLAILKAGAAYLPIDPSTPIARARFMLEEARVTLLLTEEERLPQFDAPAFPILTITRAWELLDTEASDPLPKVVTPEYPAYLIYTSGSTGTPRGVIINHKALLNLIFWHQQTFAITYQDRATQLANLGFDASVSEIWPYLTEGAQLFLIDEETRLSPPLLLNWLADRHITVCFLSTALTDMVLQMEWPAHIRLRFLLTGGDRLHHTLPNETRCTLINQYGPTENTVIASWVALPAGQSLSRLPSIGRPMSNTQLYVLNRAGEIQPIGVAGELFIGGQGVAQGYLGKPDPTAERFLPDPFSKQPGVRLYRTGDLARYLPDGTLEFLGRCDQQIKLRGFRIEIGEIEALLLNHPEVREAVVVLHERPSEEKHLIAYIVPHEEGRLTVEQICAALKEHAPDYMLPSFFSFLPTLPLTAHGKVDRRALAQRNPIPLRSQETYLAPRDAIELQLVQIWEDLLQVRPIGTTDNFFQLGGHSLAGVRLMAQIQRQFQVDLPLAALFEGATVATLAEMLRREGQEIAECPLVTLQSSGNRPPLFCVHAVGGQVLCYMDLVRHLGAQQPVYGLQAIATSAEQRSSLEEMATRYIDAIRAVQPEGPYRLCGWSMGGVLAFEMAQQLHKQGQGVAFLGLIDSYLPSIVAEDQDDSSLFLEFLQHLGAGDDKILASTYQALRNLPLEARMASLLAELQQISVLPSGIDATDLLRLFATFRRNREAFSRYQVRPYANQVTLFQASIPAPGTQVDHAHGWVHYAPQLHAIYTFPGDHYGILREPHVAALAQQLLTSLDEVWNQHTTV